MGGSAPPAPAAEVSQQEPEISLMQSLGIAQLAPQSYQPLSATQAASPASFHQLPPSWLDGFRAFYKTWIQQELRHGAVAPLSEEELEQLRAAVGHNGPCQVWMEVELQIY